MMIQEKKKAVIYCRVSTKEQVEEGNSLITQEKNCTEYAEKNGYSVERVYIEQGESAKTADRTELKKLLSFCTTKKNEIKAVIAYKIDRISRNIDDYSQIRIQLKRFGVEIKSTSEKFEDTAAGRFMENIIANVAQFDNDVRAERSIGGMRDAVREGRYVWMAPYGYSNVKQDGRTTIAPNEFSKWVVKAFNEISMNLSPVDEIRRRLTREGMITQAGKAMSRSNFFHMIRNEIYTGWMEKFGERHKGRFEPLVSEELFREVQRILDAKNKKHKQYLLESPDFPLRRFIKHPSGKMVTGSWSKGRNSKYPYYFIHSTNFSFRKEQLEHIFQSLLNRFQLDSTYYSDLRKYVKDELSSRFGVRKIDQTNLPRIINELKTKKNSLLEKNLQGVISDDFFKDRVAIIDEELRNLERKLAEPSENTIDFTRLLDLMNQLFKNPGELWANADFQDKLKLQWFYFPEGLVFDGENCRITKMCRFFKLKTSDSATLSDEAPHLVAGWNHIALENGKIIRFTFENTDPFELSDFSSWKSMAEEIEYLANLIKGLGVNRTKIHLVNN
jgi:DNA invertase Pin-like site-specific DNA recombinase